MIDIIILAVSGIFMVLVVVFERNLAFGKDDSLTSDFLVRFERYLCLDIDTLKDYYQKSLTNSGLEESRKFYIGHPIGDELIEVEVGTILSIEKGSEFIMIDGVSVTNVSQYFAILGGQTVCRVYEPVRFENGIRGWVVSVAIDSTRVFINGSITGIMPGQIVRARKHPWWSPEPFQPAMWLSPEHFL